MIAGSSLDPTQRSTLILASDALYRGELVIKAGYDRLASLFGVSRRAAINRMQSLEKIGVLEKLRGGGGRAENGRGYVNIWKLNLEALKPTQNKGAVCDTVKGAVDQHQGCSQMAARVQPVAQDQLSQLHPKEELKRGPASPAPAAQGGGGLMPPDPRDQLKPWVNHYDGPEQCRAARLGQMRTQFAIEAQRSRNHPQKPVQFKSEGGD
jgi:hypothetical protein